MTINEKKLTEMVEAVKQRLTFVLWTELEEQELRTALTPFAMEMTDEEIEKLSPNYGIERFFMYNEGFKHGAKQVRDGK